MPDLNKMNATTRHMVLKCRGEICSEEEDLVAEERRLRLSINGREVLSLFCSPVMVRELAVGFVMTEGIAEGICTERISVEYGEEISVDIPAEGPVKTAGASVTSGCVGGLTFEKKHSRAASEDGFTLQASRLRDLFARFQKLSALHAATGCVHSAALSDGREILCFAEDIGRHNAVDKAIGLALLEGIGFGGKVMLASGRLSSEIVSKCARWGIPMVASRTAPTAYALGIAGKSGVTVAGFVRGERLNVYTHAWRIIREGGGTRP